MTFYICMSYFRLLENYASAAQGIKQIKECLSEPPWQQGKRSHCEKIQYWVGFQGRVFKTSRPSSEGPLMTLLTFLHLAGNADLLALTIMQDPEVTSREEGTAG